MAMRLGQAFPPSALRLGVTIGSLGPTCTVRLRVGSPIASTGRTTMASDTLGHHYDEQPGVPLELLACTNCGTTQQQAMTGIPCQPPMGDDEQREYALAGLLAAAEYTRIQYTGMAGQGGDLLGVQEALEDVRADAQRGQLDLLGSLASITLRAASLAASVVDGMTVPRFLDLLDAEIRGWKAPDQ